jgi:hypothetical protein
MLCKIRSALGFPNFGNCFAVANRYRRFPNLRSPQSGDLFWNSYVYPVAY